MKKILVVDDIKTNRKLLRQLLTTMQNFKVIEAVNGKEAVALFESDKPDLILMDINMPEMDGFESTGAIKEIMGDNYVPIIFVTALTENSLAKALASGGDDFISKPFDIEVLKSKINAHLRIRELNLQLNDKNHQLTIHNEHLRHEQALIEHFFESALALSFLDKKYIKYHMSPMSTFNGDVLLVERGPNGGLFVVMGDFTGHGLTAAMGTLPVVMIFFKMVAEGATISEMARELNCQLNKLMPVGMFFAATIVELNMKGDSLSVWMGSMPECYMIGKNDELKNVIKSQNMALGILKDHQFDGGVETYKVEEGDRIYFYSDGIIEASNVEGEIFGSQKLKDALVKNKENRFEKVLNELKLFTGESNQSDDITLVELTCHEVPAAEL